MPARRDSAPRASSFASTRWSAVVRAGRASSVSSQRALADLCGVYWYPLFAFARRRGHSFDDARDLTQSFFAELLAKNFLASADPTRGRFRAFLLAAFEHHAAKQRRFWNALKRGGGRAHVTLDFDDAEQRYGAEPADTATPEKLYEASWARTLIERAFTAVRREYERGDRTALFERLRAHLTDEAAPERYRELAAELDMNEGALKVAIHRLRKRFRGALEREVADTLDDPAAVDDELRHLFEALGR